MTLFSRRMPSERTRRRRLEGRSLDDTGRWRTQGMWIIAGLAVAMLAAVWERSRVVSIGYEVGQLQHEREHELQRHRALLLESASLASLERIERLAEERLGLVQAAPGQIQLVRMGSGERSAVVAEAEAGVDGAHVARAERTP